ncbi:hypothetical protein HN588_15240 [Candidatus Bathyarchaeota archaeon]|jgi:hypothetical protein|nr:hypothetical protein [Candidatus Bathyarchaeota archaeon]
MKIAKTKWKQLIREELAKLTEMPEANRSHPIVNALADAYYAADPNDFRGSEPINSALSRFERSDLESYANERLYTDLSDAGK